MVRMNFQISWCVKTEKLSALIASLAKMDSATSRKNPDRNFDPGLKCYPADAV